jgi:polyisoprenyl-teichoic acid--peptidoglycan teichoic acid transferase
VAGPDVTGEAEGGVASGANDEAEQRRAIRQAARDRVATRRKSKRRPLKIVLLVAAALALILIFGAVAGLAYIGVIGREVQDKGKAILAVLAPKEHIPGPPQNILLIGSDIRKSEIKAGVKASRSDTLMLVRFDPKVKKVWILSIPRDSRVSIDGHGMEKINAAYFYGGAPLAVKTVNEFTGVPINGYVEVGFESFKELVDTIGGVWVNVEKPPGAPYIDDIMAANHDESARIVKPGYQKLDGKHALTYVRARHQFLTQDHKRIEHQQTFIRALLAQTMRFQNVFKIPQLIGIFRRNVRTSLSVQDMTELALDMRGVSQRSLDATQVPGADKKTTAWYFIPDLIKLRVLTDRMIASEPFKGVETSQTVAGAGTGAPSSPGAAQVTVAVRNGTPTAGLGRSMANRLKALGFTVGDVSTAKQSNYVASLIMYKAGHMAEADQVRQALGMGNVQQARQVAFSTDVLVVVGSDFQPTGGAR